MKVFCSINFCGMLILKHCATLIDKENPIYPDTEFIKCRTKYLTIEITRCRNAFINELRMHMSMSNQLYINMHI